MLFNEMKRDNNCLACLSSRNLLKILVNYDTKQSTYVCIAMLKVFFIIKLLEAFQRFLEFNYVGC